MMEYLELTVTRCGKWTGNRRFIWSSLIEHSAMPIYAGVDLGFFERGGGGGGGG